MSSLAIFIIIVILANLFDKKKPPAKRIPMPGQEMPQPQRPKQENLKQHQARLKDMLKEKFKPKQPKQTVPLPMTDEKGAPMPDAYTTDANEVINKYQKYAEEHERENETAYDNECEKPYDYSHKDHSHYNRGNGLPNGDKVSLAQAIVYGEILGKPRSKVFMERHRRR